LRSLLTGASAASRWFKANIRRLNNLFSMASSGSYETMRAGISFLALSGNLHHFIGPPRPRAWAAPKFAQLYILDAEYAQLEARVQQLRDNNVEGFDQQLLRDLQAMLLEHNRLVVEFKAVAEVASGQVSLRCISDYLPAQLVV
jgi:hypothetical protein